MPENTTDPAKLEELAIHTIRILSAEGVQAAKSGHPGLPMGCADAAYALFTKALAFNPQNPDWPNRDRFVLSAGHGSMLIYSMLHLCGYDLPIEELRNFRQWESKTPGHPEYGDTPGVEMTAGPLGAGFATAVGMALAEQLLAARYNTAEHAIVDHYTYAIVSDGELMEGISHEAASIAGHLGLGKLIYFYDDNEITIEGKTSLTYSEDAVRRFEAYGWHVQEVNGQDHCAVAAALEAARAETDRPSIIVGKTTIGYGAPNKAGTHGVHGAPLGDDEIAAMKESLGWDFPPFTVPDAVKPLFNAAAEAGTAKNAAWDELFADYQAKNSELAAEFLRTQKGDLPNNWRDALPVFSSDDKPIATRAASGKVINAIASTVPELVGGSADLAPSNNTFIADGGSVSRDDMSARNLHFGVREHAMGALMNGMALHGGLRPYGGTFLVFSDYMRGSVRLAALMKQPVVFVWTHDSIFVGEDGPTHQPIEHAASLRAMPNLRVFRPADANETAAAWTLALENGDGPSALLLTRQGLPTSEDTVLGKGVERGAYVLERESGDGDPDVILIATGSEVSLSREAAKILAEQGVRARVVSMPCWELFEEQDTAYRDSVLPPSVTKRVAVEAGCTFGWERWVGLDGAVIGLDRFGASARAGVLAEKFGFTAENVAARAAEIAKS